MAETLEKPLDEQTKEELAATLAAATKPAEDVKPNEQKFEFVAADGTRYEATSQEDLFAKVTGALNNTKEHAKKLEWKLRDQKETTPKPETKPATTGAFSKDEYYKLMETDPLAAQDYLDKHRFGKDPKQMVTDIINEHEVAKSHEVRTLQEETQAFYDSPAGREFAQVETKELDQLLLGRLQEQNLPVTAWNLKAAYRDLKDDGKIPSVGKPAERPRPNPSSAVGPGGQIPPEEPDFSTMSKSELAAYMKKNGVAVPAGY